jgi:outer membrane biosynthesis protein TonB
VSDGDLNRQRSQLRVAYVWRDEVMADVVALEPRKITLGTRGRATFVTPDLGLPARFPIFRHSRRGYLVTLGTGMAGRMSVGGEELDVAEFVRNGHGDRAASAQGSFRATVVAPGDWGVIWLDGRGEHCLFFQFVKPDPRLPRATWRDSNLLMPSLAFAAIVHAVFVIVAIGFRDDRHSMAFPGKREIMAEYLLTRPQPPPEPVPEPKAGEKKKAETQKKPAATVGKEGKAGGKGEKPRSRAPDPDKGEPDEIPAAVQVGLLSAKSRTELRKVRERGGFDEKLGRALARIQGPLAPGSMGGHGKGIGTGFGPGEGTGTSTRGGSGTGGGGKNLGDVQRHGSLDTGGTRAGRGGGGRGVKEVAVTVDAGEPSGDLGGLTAAEILKVVRSRKNAIGNCYERELQRQKGLGGKVVLTWRITASGSVESARVRTTTMRNGKVEDCIVRQIQGLHFPQPRGGQVANVRNFPFLFAPR